MFLACGRRSLSDLAEPGVPARIRSVVFVFVTDMLFVVDGGRGRDRNTGVVCVSAPWARENKSEFGLNFSSIVDSGTARPIENRQRPKAVSFAGPNDVPASRSPDNARRKPVTAIHE